MPKFEWPRANPESVFEGLHVKHAVLKKFARGKLRQNERHEVEVHLKNVCGGVCKKVVEEEKEKIREEDERHDWKLSQMPTHDR